METSTGNGRRGPIEGEHLIGYDASPDRRPGDPMHRPSGPADGAPAGQPVEQRGIETRTHRAGLVRATPVFGTAQPPRGVSGALRRAAYRIPEHHARHWVLLMAADRLNVLEDRLRPASALALATGLALGVALVGRRRR